MFPYKIIGRNVKSEIMLSPKMAAHLHLTKLPKLFWLASSAPLRKTSINPMLYTTDATTELLYCRRNFEVAKSLFHHYFADVLNWKLRKVSYESNNRTFVRLREFLGYKITFHSIICRWTDSKAWKCLIHNLEN